MGDSSMKTSPIDYVSITTETFGCVPYLVLCIIFKNRNNAPFQNNWRFQYGSKPNILLFQFFSLNKSFCDKGTTAFTFAYW